MSSEKSEFAQIMETVTLYYDGHYYGDLEKLKKAFHANCYIVGHFENDLEYLLRDAYLDYIREQKPPAELGHAYQVNVVSIEITGTAAVVKVADEYLGYRYTDYLSMIKIDDQWVIVCKAYNTDGKI